MLLKNARCNEYLELFSILVNPVLKVYWAPTWRSSAVGWQCFEQYTMFNNGQIILCVRISQSDGSIYQMFRLMTWKLFSYFYNEQVPYVLQRVFHIASSNKTCFSQRNWRRNLWLFDHIERSTVKRLGKLLTSTWSALALACSRNSSRLSA